VQRKGFYAGLFLTTLATLLLELLNTRLLSVLTWYHLSFFAISTAMFGMSAGAIRVYLGGAEFEGERARTQLARFGTLFALSIPIVHVIILCIPISLEFTAASITAVVVITLLVSVPFYLSGVLVAICLTRIPGRSGLVYGIDLVGAAMGSLLVIPVLKAFDISSANLICGALAACGAALFHRGSAKGRPVRIAALAVLLVAAAGVNTRVPEGFRVVFPKGFKTTGDVMTGEAWTIHGRVVTKKESTGAPQYWGPGKGWKRFRAKTIPMDIDGMAATSITRWDGDTNSLVWTKFDVTALAYHLRKRGDVGIIGVGGGRDVLTALWAMSQSVTGIEINEAFLDLLDDRFRDYANIVQRPEVRLVHDEARSYLTRTKDRYDVLQMSLVDTWAATGAGAFTLSENGLYTVEAWREFLNVLKPNGIFTSSRWYNPEQVAETSRLLALATAALIDRGVENPAAHIALVGHTRAATLLLGRNPLSPQDIMRLEAVSAKRGFKVLLAPGRPAASRFFSRIVSSRTAAELDAAVEDDRFDFTPPTDQRPFFFNILKPGGLLTPETADEMGVTITGNLLATRTLLLLWVISAILVATVILGPLWRAGLPSLRADSFAQALAYFGIIGTGFMLVQIPLMQRFSVYLGHPTYAVAVILFSMILATGIGSMISDRLQFERNSRWLVVLTLGAGAILALGTILLQPVIDASFQQGLFIRCVVVATMVSAMSLPLGFFFPIGLRLVRRLSDDASPWMWGVNGACGVLASVTAIAISMWGSIDINILIAAALYMLLSIPAGALWRAGEA